MLKKLSLSILTALVLTSTSFAADSSSEKILSLKQSPINPADIMLVSADWSKANSAAYKFMVNAYEPKVAIKILESVPELAKNKRALVSITIGLIITLNQTNISPSEAMQNLSTHKYLIDQPKLSLQEAIDALSYSVSEA